MIGCLDGEPAVMEVIADPSQAATILGRLITALHKVDIADAPRSGSANHHCGVPLIQRDDLARKAIHGLRGIFNSAALTRAWEAALSTPPWTGAPVWLRSDLNGGNLLSRRGPLMAAWISD
ncbi:hypothetical protein [Actibacterium sp. 188UL27-1]|uniref:hypothetical protein n=1 Tax=Actibacterium sp. 188UL27-1 TaxID=2786961 RepID=UPI00195C2DCA|nr:hypothetical protein [Actibacterium sp. 188UL27-1]MBM7068236.1 hypothetical protein [Actibacterium sp. 188UL27-1]